METSIRINPVTVDDFRQMDMDWSGHMDFGLQNYWEEVLKVARTAGLFLDDQCVFILGGVPDQTGIMTVFALASNAVRDNRHIRRLLMKYSNLGLQMVQTEQPCHFLQAIVKADNRDHIAFIEHFGFEGGYLLPGYTPSGEDVRFYYKQIKPGDTVKDLRMRK